MSCGASMMEVVRGEVLDKYDGTPGCARRWDYEEVSLCTKMPRLVTMVAKRFADVGRFCRATSGTASG